MHRPILAISLLVALALASPATAAVLHVPGDHATIEAACAAAADGDTLEIAAGYYIVDAAVLSTDGLHLRGATGDPADVVLEPTGSYNSIFVTFNEVTDPFRFEALTFQGGAAVPSGETGSVFYMTTDKQSGSYIQFSGCVFRHFSYGQSIRVESWGIPFAFRFEDCVFHDNAGGAYTSSVGGIFRRCRFLDNVTDLDCGAIDCRGTIVLEECTFAGNSADRGAALLIRSNLTSVLARDCTFVGNTGASGGAAIHVTTTDSPSNATAYFERCIVAFNDGAAVTHVGDGGYAVQGTEIVFIATDIYGNTVSDWDTSQPWGSRNHSISRFNISEDPLLCDAAARDFNLQSGSPCLEENNGWYDMGAHGSGCGLAAAPDDPAPIRIGRLAQNSPNPFNPATEIAFELERAGVVRLEVYDLRGALVRTLLDEQRSAGRHTKAWDGRDDGGRRLPSGVYMYRLETGGLVETRAMTLVR